MPDCIEITPVAQYLAIDNLDYGLAAAFMARFLALCLFTFMLGCSAGVKEGINTDRSGDKDEFQGTGQPTQEDSLSENGEDGAEKNGVRIGLLLPFSAVSVPVREMAEQMFEAAQLAIFDSNNPDITLLVKDTRGEENAAAAAAATALEQGATLLLGPVYSSAIRSVGEVARPYGVPVIAFSSDESARALGVYLFGFPKALEVERVVSFAVRNGKSALAVMLPADARGDGILTAVTDSLELCERASVVATQRYGEDTNAMMQAVRDFARFVRRGSRQITIAQDSADGLDLSGIVEEQPPEESASETQAEEQDNVVYPMDSILIAEGGNRLRSFLPLLPAYGIDVRKVGILGDAGMNDADIAADPLLERALFAAPDPARADIFRRHFLQTYNKLPMERAVLAYDAVLFAGDIYRREGTLNTDSLASPVGFEGASGLFRFTSQGQLERGLAVMEIRSRRIRVIDPAPRRFAREDLLEQSAFIEGLFPEYIGPSC